MYILAAGYLIYLGLFTHIIKNLRFAGLKTRLEHLLNDVTYATCHDKLPRTLS